MAAACQDSAHAGEVGTVAKLTRVMMLAPVVFTLGLMAVRRAAHGANKSESRAAPPMPWFVLGFIGMVIFNGVVTIPAEPKAWITVGTTLMRSMALAAIGIETDFRKLKAEGLKPMLLATAAWIFISIFALALVKLTAYS